MRMRFFFFAVTVSAFALLLLFGSACPAGAAELLVTDRANNTVVAFDESTGELLRVVSSSGLDEPAGLTFGDDGYLYVANSAGFPGGSASVSKINPDTGVATDFITDVAGAGGIAYHAASDTFFVSELGAFDGDEVFRYSSNGTLLQTLGTGSAATGRTGLAFDAAGNLYISEFNLFLGTGSVLKYDAPVGDPNGDYATSGSTFASAADISLAGPFPGFNGLTFDDNGDLFVASLGGQVVLKFDVDSGSVTSGAPFGSPLAYPSGITLGGDGILLVTNLGNDNPSDPIYGPNLFPGGVNRRDVGSQGTSPLLVGDINRDAIVNGADLSVWETAYGSSSNGDLDSDFDTDGLDFLLWLQGYGNKGQLSAFQPTGAIRYEPALLVSVPEPATCLMALVGAFVLLTRRQTI